MNHPTVNRRALLRTAAWSVPAVSLAAAAPSFATSTATEACVLPTTPTTWNAQNLDSTYPTGLHDANETGWTAGTSPVSGSLISTAHMNSFTNTRPYTVTNTQVASPITLPANSFVSWANNPSGLHSTFLRVEYAFPVSGAATVTLANQLLMQFGNPAVNAARQTLTVRLFDGAAPAQVVGRVAAARERAGAGHPVTTSAPHPVSDAQLAAQGFTLVDLPATTPRRYLVDWATAPVVLPASGARTIRVQYEFELYPQLVTGGINDDLAIFAPVVTEAAAC